MAYKSGDAYIQVTPSLSGWQRSIRRQLREELQGAGFDVPVEPEIDPAKARKDGEQYGGAFSTAAKRRIDAALRNLPEPKLGLDASDADRELAALRARLAELRDKHIRLELDDAGFLAETRRAQAELDNLARRSPNIQVRVDAGAAAAELAALRAEVDSLDGRTINFDVDTSRGVSRFGTLLTVGLALGPALIPVGAAITAAFGAIGTGAVLGAGGLGTLALAFGGVGEAVKELGKEHKQTGQTAQQAYAQQLSSANAVLSAQDSLRAAQQQVRVATESASRAVTAALARQRAAEQSLVDAQRSALRAQQALNDARRDARRALEDLAFSVQDNALAQRRADLDLQQAQEALAALPSTATPLERQQAQLAADEALQRITELRVQGERLRQDKTLADEAGVSGSRQVTAAQDALVAANQRVREAQDQVRASADAVTQAQVDGARRVEQAEQAVVQAARSLTQAQAQQAAQASRTVTETDKLAESLNKLSPAGQNFARFVATDLKPRLDQLRATAQAGLLPGVERGIRAALPVFGLLDQTIGEIARAFGDLAGRAGEALTDPFWTGFFTFIRDEAGPSTRTFGEILGNLAQGAAGLLQAFKPVWDGMGEGLLRLSERFANFGTAAAAGKSDSFTHFLEYVQQTWPQVRELFSQLLTLVGHLIEAFSGQGLSTLSLLNTTLRFINSLPPGTLQLLIDLFIAYRLLRLATGVIGTIQTAIDLLGDKGILGALKKIRAFGGLQGALGTATVGGAGKGKLGAATRTAGTLAGGALLIGTADDLSGGGVGNTLNTLAGAPQRAPGTTFSSEVGALLSGDFSFGQGPPNPGSWDDPRNLPENLLGLWRDTQTKLGGIWSNIQSDAATKFAGMSTSVTAESQAATGNVSTTWSPVPGLLSGNWGGIWNTATDLWGRVSGTIGGKAADAKNTAELRMGELGVSLSQRWDTLWADANTKWQNLSGTIGGFAARTRDDVVAAFRWAIDKIGEIWGKLGDLAKKPVNFVIDVVYNRGIVGLWNKIAGVFGLGTLSPIPLLAEGGVLPGYAPGRDTVPAVLSPGEGVLVPEAVRGLGPQFVHDANRHFSGGRARSTGTAAFAEGGIVGALQSGWDWASGLFTDPVGTVKRLFSGILNLGNTIPGRGMLRDALAKLPGKVVDTVVAAAKKLVATAGSAPLGGGSGVERWRPVGLQALAIAGQSPANIGRLLMQMRTESGGNPTAVNRSDINWQRGTPSVGLMQVIGPTYRAYKHPAFDRGPYLYGVSTDGLSNILAATRYTVSRYGSLAAGWQGHGYDFGGVLPPGGVGWNTTRRDERVLAPAETEAFHRLVDALTERGGLTAINLPTPRRAELAGTLRSAVPDPAAMYRVIEQAVQRAAEAWDGAELRLADDGRHAVARISRRQQQVLDRL